MRRRGFLFAGLAAGFLQTAALGQEIDNPIVLPSDRNSTYWFNAGRDLALARDKTLLSASDERTFVAGKDTILDLKRVDPDRVRTRTVRKGEVVFALKRGGRGPWFSIIYWGPHGPIEGRVDRDDLIPTSRAIDFLTDEVERQPTATGFLNRAIVWSMLGQIDNALADCNQAISLEPRNANAYEIRGCVWERADAEKRAVADWDHAIGLQPQNLAAHLALAVHWQESGRDQQAMNEFDLLLQFDPNYFGAELARHRARTAKTANDKAIAECDQAIKRNPKDILALNRRAKARLARGEREPAIADWSAAIAAEPLDVTAYKFRGSAWAAAGAYDKAINDWNMAIHLEPGQAESHANRAMAFMLKGSPDQAIADWNEMIRLDDTAASGYSNRGSAWKRKGEYAKAIADYNQALRLDPGFGEAHWGLAEIYAACPDARYRNGDRAVESVVKAIRLLGSNKIGLLLTAATAYAEQGDFDSACKWQERAVSRAPEDSIEKYEAVLKSYRAHRTMHEASVK
jgi:tetratricopeptide (TPR) repeat protein